MNLRWLPRTWAELDQFVWLTVLLVACLAAILAVMVLVVRTLLTAL